MSVCAVGKRPFDSMDVGFGSPQCDQNMGFQGGFMGTPPKRCRAGSPTSNGFMAGSPQPHFDMGCSSPPRKTPFNRMPQSPSRYLPAVMAPIDVLSVIDHVAPQRKRIRYQEAQSSDEMGRPMPVAPPQQEVVFTLDQVTSIVQRALDEKEAAMREEFDVIIRQTLAEQFDIFTKVNEDYISRRLRDSPYDYTS